MSRFQAFAASAASSAQQAVRYEKVWDEGAIVERKIPKRVRRGVFDLCDDPIPFLQFALAFPGPDGGLMNLFVHTDDSTIAGTTIIARVTIWKKIFVLDGRSYLHVDLKPVSRSMDPTHRLLVMGKFDLTPPEGSPAFYTPEPVKGVIAIVPPDYKVY